MMNIKDLFDANKKNVASRRLIIRLWRLFLTALVPLGTYVLIDGFVSYQIRHIYYPEVPASAILKAYVTKVVFEIPLVAIYVLVALRVRRFVLNSVTSASIMLFRIRHRKRGQLYQDFSPRGKYRDELDALIPPSKGYSYSREKASFFRSHQYTADVITIDNSGQFKNILTEL